MTTYPFPHQYDRAVTHRAKAGNHGALPIMLLLTLGIVLSAAAVRRSLPTALAAGMADWDLVQWGGFLTLLTTAGTSIAGGVLWLFKQIMAELRLNRAATEASQRAAEATVPMSQLNDLLTKAAKAGAAEAMKQADGTTGGRPNVVT